VVPSRPLSPLEGGRAPFAGGHHKGGTACNFLTPGASRGFQGLFFLTFAGLFRSIYFSLPLGAFFGGYALSVPSFSVTVLGRRVEFSFFTIEYRREYLCE